VFVENPDAEAAAGALNSVPEVREAWVEPTVGVAFEFHPGVVALPKIMAALHERGLLPLSENGAESEHPGT